MTNLTAGDGNVAILAGVLACRAALSMLSVPAHIHTWSAYVLHVCMICSSAGLQGRAKHAECASAYTYMVSICAACMYDMFKRWLAGPR
jgi:hypothetical protein